MVKVISVIDPNTRYTKIGKVGASCVYGLDDCENDLRNQAGAVKANALFVTSKSPTEMRAVALRTGVGELGSVFPRLKRVDPQQKLSQATSVVLAPGAKIAVLDFKNYASELKPENSRYLSDVVRAAALREAPSFEVITRENLLVLLQSSNIDPRVVRGRMRSGNGPQDRSRPGHQQRYPEFGTRIKVSLRLHDTRSGRLLSASEASGRDELDDALHISATDLIRALR